MSEKEYDEHGVPLQAWPEVCECGAYLGDFAEEDEGSEVDCQNCEEVHVIG